MPIEDDGYEVLLWVKGDSSGDITASHILGPNVTVVLATQVSKGTTGWKLYRIKLGGSGESLSNIDISIPNGWIIDDVRINPVKSEVKTYVYHRQTDQLVSILDAQHYATVYVHDESERLAKVNRETSRGLQTVKSYRTNFKYNQ